MKQIASRDNPTFKHLRALAEDGRYRRREHATLLDGVHLVQSALAAGHLPRRVLVAEKAKQSAEIVLLLEALSVSACELIELSETLLRALSPVDTPSGIVAEMVLPEARADDSPDFGQDMLLIEAVQDAGNLGTLLRTAAAAGVSRVLLSEHCAQAWSPKVLRAGMGAHFVLDIREQSDLAAALVGWQGNVIATALNPRSRSLFDLDLRAPVAWMFGSEGSGLSDALITRASHLACIPMAPGSESLNVAAAAAVCLFEQVRQRGVQ